MSNPSQRTHAPIEDQPINVDLKADKLHLDRLEGRRLRKFFETCIKHEASDLILRSGAKIRLRLRGDLRPLDADPFTVEELEEDIEFMLTEDQLKHFTKHGSVDIAYQFDDDNRFRVNIFRAKGNTAIAARRVSSKILTYEQLHLPPIMAEIAEAREGLILLCGVTGSGKSTTIASMLQQINETRLAHILTLEDPIEYIFKDSKCIVNQREIGMDLPNFAEGLKALVRENPDVVLIGELRDRETFEAAVQAAETGHLVFGTIHASGAAQSFSRIYNLFAPEERDLIRDMFSTTMKAIVYQKLLPTLMPDVPRVPALEILINNPVVTKFIQDGREVELNDVIKDSLQEGMLDFSTSLVQLVQKEYIHPKEALANAHNPDELKMRLKGIS